MIPVMRVRDENGNVKDVVAVAAPTMPAPHAQKHGVGGSDPITLEMIGASDAKTHRLSTYTFLSQIGLSGEVTMVRVCEAMPLYSMLVLPNNRAQATNYVSDVPDDYGTITVTRAELNYCVATYIRSNGTALNYYVGKYQSIAGWSGWKQMATTAYAVNKAGDTMNGNLSISKAKIPALVLNNTTSGRVCWITDQETDNTVSITNRADDDNRNSLVIGSENRTLDDLLRLYHVVDGVGTVYKVLHTGNMENLNAARIVTGTYVGAGTAEDPGTNVLNLSISPRLLIVAGDKKIMITVRGMMTGLVFMDNISQPGIKTNSVSWEDSTVRWRNDYLSDFRPEYQMNVAGMTYHYIAIG